MENHWTGATRWAAVGSVEPLRLVRNSAAIGRRQETRAFRGSDSTQRRRRRPGAGPQGVFVREGRGEPKGHVEPREAEPSPRSGSRLSRRARRSVLVAYGAGWKVPRRVNRKLSATDGPFAETKEGLGGSFLRNQDAAIEVVPKVPPARLGRIEVRPMIAIETYGLARAAKLRVC